MRFPGNITERLFLVDENLPPDLAKLLRHLDLNAIHINETRQHAAIHVPDRAIRKYSIYHPCVVVSSDDDFVSSHVSRRVPDKLIFVYRLSGKDQILSSFNRHQKQILDLLADYDLVEINEKGLKTPLG